jgi:hypothetical protein
MLGAVALAAAACAPVRVAGRDFPTAGFATLKLNQTTDQQAEAALGPPFKRFAFQGTAANPRGALPVGTPLSMSVLTYEYGLSNGGPAVSGHAVGKFATLIFLGGRLAAYDVNSTIPGDENPPIDDARLALLHQGITTRNDIIGLMGAPSGQSVAFSFLPESKGHMTYVWTHFDGVEIRHKVLMIELDARDIMTRYALVDRSGPAQATPPSAAPPAPPIVVPKSVPLTTRS